MDRRSAAVLLTWAGLAAHAFLVPVSMAGAQVALVVAAAGILLTPPRPLRTALDLPLLVFVAVAVLSDLVSPEGPPGLDAATLWRPALGFLVVAHGLRLLPPDAALRILSFACAGLALSSLAGVVQYRSGVDPVVLLHLRSTSALLAAPGVPERFGAIGFFASALSFGHNAIVLAAFLLGALAAGAIPAQRIWVAAGTAVLGLAAVAVTFDRAAYVALGVVVLLIVLLAAPRVRRALLPALGLLVLLGTLHGGIRDRFASAFSAAGHPERVFAWTQGLRIFREHPLGGVGFGNYPRVCARSTDRAGLSSDACTGPHNLELSALAEMGPLGLAALLWLFAAAAWALWRRLPDRRLALGGLAALAALLVVAQAHDVFADGAVISALWLALGLSLSPEAAASRRWPPARAG